MSSAHSIIRPVSVLARPGVRLFLTSATILFVELLLIRWIPANVVYVGYFSNLILMASFLGIGLGILFGRTGRTSRIPLFSLTLFAVVVLVSKAQLNVQLTSPDDVYFGLADEAHAADVNFLVLPLVILLTTAVMTCLALPLGTLLRSSTPLRVYTIDIVGSLFGIATFTLLALLGTTPAVWFAVVAILLTLQALGTGIRPFSAVSAAAIVAVIAITMAQGDIWSPYQRITVLKDADTVSILANGVPHQGFYLSPTRDQGSFYTQVDRWFPGRTYDNVLIVGAGSGNDTAVAIARGAKSIDAVEIDPAIQQIGVDLHPNHPYQDPRVHRSRRRRPGLPSQLEREVRPHRLRPARLADPRQLDGESPSRVVPLHDPGLHRRPGSPGARRHLRDLQLLSRAVAPHEARLDARYELRQPADRPRIRRPGWDGGGARRGTAGGVAPRRPAAR